MKLSSNKIHNILFCIIFSSNNMIASNDLINSSKLRIIRNYESKNSAAVSEKFLIIQ